MTMHTKNLMQNEAEKIRKQIARLEAIKNHLLNSDLNSTIQDFIYLNQKAVKKKIKLSRIKSRFILSQ